MIPNLTDFYWLIFDILQANMDYKKNMAANKDESWEI